MTLKSQIDRFSQNEENFNALITGSAGTTVDLGEAGIVKSVATVIGEIAPGVDKGAWATTTAYVINDIVLESGAYYRCRENHTSGTFATDLAAGKWRLNQGGDSTILTHRGRALDDAFTARFETVTAMIADTGLQAGDRVVTFANQNGAAIRQEWKIVDATALPQDGGQSILLTGTGKYAEQILPQYITPEHYGAYADGVHDDNIPIQTVTNLYSDVTFSAKSYFSSISITPKKQGQKFHGVRGPYGTRLLVNGHYGFFDESVAFVEFVEYSDFTLASTSAGNGIGLYSTSAVYLPTFRCKGVSFEKSLRICIEANIILARIKDCVFGMYGTAGATHQHIISLGQDLSSSSNLNTNLNNIEECVFRGAKGTQYASEFSNGLMVRFANNDFELNDSTVAVLRFNGILGVFFSDMNWFERNTGTYLISCGMDTIGTYQGCDLVSLQHCWFDLHTNNTHVIHSDTANFSCVINQCAGSGFASKKVLKVISSNDPTGYVKSFLYNKFTGYVAGYQPDSMYSPYFTAPISPNYVAKASNPQLEMQSTSGTVQNRLIGSTGTLNARADTAIRFQTLTGVDRAFVDANGLAISGGGWNSGRLRLGSYHLWVDATGDLRIKSSAPTSDTDGTVVGTQT